MKFLKIVLHPKTMVELEVYGSLRHTLTCVMMHAFVWKFAFEVFWRGTYNLS